MRGYANYALRYETFADICVVAFWQREIEINMHINNGVSFCEKSSKKP